MKRSDSTQWRCLHGMLIGTALVLCAQSAPGQRTGWPMYRANAQNTSISSHFGVRKVAHAWDIEWLGWYGSGYPCVGGDGTIHFTVDYEGGEDYAELVAVRPDGSIRWSVRLLDSEGGELDGKAAPLIGLDGTVYVGWLWDDRNLDRDLIVVQAYDADGKRLWSFEQRIRDQAPVARGAIMGPDGTIYLALSTWFGGGGRSSLFALDSADGSLKWRFISPKVDAFHAPPALGRNGKLYYASLRSGSGGSRGYLYCLDSATGALEWSRQLGGGSGGSAHALTIDPDGNLYLAENPWEGVRSATKFDSQGNELWTYETGSGPDGPAVVDRGRVYLPFTVVQLRGLHVLDAQTGQRVSILEPGKTGTVSPAVDPAGNIYFRAGNDLVAYDAAGGKLWQIDSGTVHLVLIGHDRQILAAPGVWGLSAYGSSVRMADLNCDGLANALDIEPFILILFDPDEYARRYPDCDGQTAGDLNVDGRLDAGDIEPFIAELFGD